MSFQEIVEQLPQLSRDEKLKLLEILAMQVREVTFAEDTSYEIWSPFDSYAAAADLQKLLDEHKQKDKPE